MSTVFKYGQEAINMLANKYSNRKEYNKMNNKDKIVVCVNGEYFKPYAIEMDARYGGSPEVTIKMTVDEFYKVAETASKSTLIKKVHFNPPATVVLWVDGSKTVVKAQEGDNYDPEKGLAMAIAKKALGNKGNFNDVFKKHLEPYYKDVAKCNVASATGAYNDFIEKFWCSLAEVRLNDNKPLLDAFNEKILNKKDSDGE